MISIGGTPLEAAGGVVSIGVALVAVPVGLFVVFLLVIACRVGLGYVAEGVSGFVTRTRVAMTEPVDPRDAPDSGYALVVGRAFDGPDGLLTAPGSNRDAIGYRYRVCGESAYIDQWTITEGGHAGRFLLEGPTQRILVDPGETAPTELEDWRGYDVAAVDVEGYRSGTEDPRDPLLAAAVDDGTEIDPDRYEEAVLERGREVYVYGQVTEDPVYDGCIDASESTGFVVDVVPPDDALDARDAGWRGSAKRALEGLLGFAIAGTLLTGLGVLAVRFAAAALGLELGP